LDDFCFFFFAAAAAAAAVVLGDFLAVLLDREPGRQAGS